MPSGRDQFTVLCDNAPEFPNSVSHYPFVLCEGCFRSTHWLALPVCQTTQHPFSTEELLETEVPVVLRPKFASEAPPVSVVAARLLILVMRVH